MEAKREWVPPSWGPVADPGPWGPWGPWGPRVPIPKFPPWGPGDPSPLRERLLEKIEVEDLISLQVAQLESVRAQLQAQAKLVGEQIKILAKYGQGK